MVRFVFLLFFLFTFLMILSNCSNTDQNHLESVQIVDSSYVINNTSKTELSFENKDNQTKHIVQAEWVELIQLDSTIVVDMKYATTDNFVKEKLYPCNRCFLRPEVAEAIVVIHKELKKQGLGLKMFDCFRPRPIQWRLWEIIPDPRYVSDPSKGSMHNRGGAVDLTILDREGNELDMGTPFDFFGFEAYHTNMNLPAPILKNRTLLKSIMESHGFRSIRTEWWHYSFMQKSYELSNMIWNCPGL